MGAGFIRRFGYMPGVEELTAIEGVVIVDQPSPGPIRGASYGVVAVIGEAADMTYACKVNTSGEVVSSMRPVEVYGGSDLIEKIGPFDRYLGKFGAEMGNLFVELRNKRFSRLVVVPVDLVRPTGGTTQYASRYWRQLPTNRSATDATPIVPVTGVRIEAGTEFKNSTNRVRLAQSITFTGGAPISSGVDGTTVTTGFPAATTTLVRASGSWNTDGALEGDLIVPGSLNSAAATQNGDCALAGTLRIVSVDSDTDITVQRLDGSNFTTSIWASGSALAWRLHKASDGDTGGEHQYSEAAGYTVLARPLDATISAGLALTPSVVPTAASGTYWGSTSGLTGRQHPSGALTYAAAVHAVNPATNATIQARYQEAIDSLLNDIAPINEVSVVVSARKDATIAAAIRSHVMTASSRGMSRVTVMSPSLSIVSKATVIGMLTGSVRNERVFFSWPGCRTFIPELVGISVSCPDSTTTDDGVIDTTFDTWLACLLSRLQPELNPGQAASPVPETFAPVLGYQRGCPTLDMSDFILFKQYGIAALRMDRVSGPLIQSGVTTSLTTGETTINRRRMADFIQDSLAARYNSMAKMLGRQSIKDALLAETDAFLGDLVSENNPEMQRIHSYSLDDKTPNTPTLEAQGIWIIKTTVRMLQTMDTLVLQSEVSPSGISVTAV